MAHEWQTSPMGNAWWHANTFNREIVFTDEIENLKEPEMSFWKKLWSKIKKVPWWVWPIFPIVLIALFFRPPRWLSKKNSRSTSTPGLTPKQGEEEIERIHESAGTRRDEIDEEKDEVGKKADELRELLK